MADAREFKKRLEKLQGLRSNFDTYWDQVQLLTDPDGQQFLTTRSPGEQNWDRVFDPSAALGAGKFAAAMESFLTPRFERWHTLRATNDELMEDRQVKAFFEAVTDTLFKSRAAPKARFYGQVHEGYQALARYGNMCVYVDGNPMGRGTRYRYIPVANAWIEVDHTGAVDTIYYKYCLTAKAAKQKWPHAQIDRVEHKLEAGQDFDELEFLHVVKPNPERDPSRADAPGMRFVGYDIAFEDEEIIPTPNGEEFSGFREMPYIWSRYTVSPGEKYGRGPLMMALPAIRTLQEMEKTFLRSGQKVADPPLLVAHDGRLGRGHRRIRLQPGGLNYGAVDESGRAKIVPLNTGARLDITLEMADRYRTIIDDALLINLFDILAQDRVEMTATEVLERAKEKGQLTTPLVGRQQAEFLGPLIEREIGVLGRQGALPPMPEVLVEAEGQYEIVYDSTATRMQASDEVSAYQRLVEIFAKQAELDPALLQVLNAEDAMREFGELMGVRSTLFKTPNEMQKIRQAQAQAAQAAAAAESAPNVAKATKDLAEVQGR